MRKVLFILLLTPMFFSACKKEEDIPVKNEFTITGIHDVDMGVPGANVLGLTVMLTSGVQERVIFSAGGLPPGITTIFAPASSTPDFTYLATFHGNCAPGTYPINITGTSASFTKSYDLNLIVPFNGWIADGTTYLKASLQRLSTGALSVLSFRNASTMATLDFAKQGAFPTADGTYMYTLGNAPINPSEVSVYFRDMNSNSSNNDFSNKIPGTTMLTLIISGGMLKVTLPATTMTSGPNSEMTLKADLIE